MTPQNDIGEAVMNRLKWWLWILVPAVAFAEVQMEERTLELPAEGIHRLVVTCGAGSLEVSGGGDSRRLTVDAFIELDDRGNDVIGRRIADHLQLGLEKRGDQAVLYSRIALKASEKLESRIHLKVTLPGGIDLKIVDGSGAIRIRNLAGDLTIDDDSGPIDIDTVAGRVFVGDGSGHIAIQAVTGNVFVKDGSGPIDISGVDGDLFVTDGTGDILIRRVRGSVTVTDGSGDIDISDVGANLSIPEAGSGELHIERIAGKITTPDENFAPTGHSDE